MWSRNHCTAILLLLLLFTRNATRAHGQAANNEGAKNDSIAITKLIGSSFSNSSRDPSQGLKDANEVIRLSTLHGWKAYTAAGHRLLGNNYVTLTDYTHAISHYEESLKISEALGDDASAAKTLGNLGIVQMNQGAYAAALDYYLQALKINEREGRKVSIGNNLGNIANLYRLQGEYVKALDYSARSHQVYEALHDTMGMGAQEINQAMICQSQKNNKSALQLFLHALELFRQVKDAKGQATVFNNLGELYTQAGRSEEAFEALRKSSAINHALKNDGGLLKAKVSLSHLYLRAAQDSIPLFTIATGRKITKDDALKAAIVYSDSAIIQAKALNRKEDLEAALLVNASARKFSGQYSASIKSYEDALSLHDSLYSMQNARKFIGLESKREIELRDKELKISSLELREQMTIRYVMLSFVMLLSLIGLLIYRQSTLRKKANLMLTISNRQLDEANRIKARFFGILSHDLRAPISNLTSYLYLQREAPELMDEASRKSHQLTIELAANNLLSVMEDLLLWSKGQMTSFKPTIKTVQVLQLFEEIKKLLPYDTTTAVVFDDPGLLQMDTDENFLKTIMRNLTANALKALGDQPGGKVEWKAWEAGGQSFMSITDNGPGLTKEQLGNLFSESGVTSAKTGLGLHIVRDFAQMLGQKIEVRSEVGKGTSFTISKAA